MQMTYINRDRSAITCLWRD